MSSTTTPAPRRNVALVAADIVVSFAILIFALLFGLVALGFAAQFGNFGSICGAGPYSGLECNATALGVATYGLLTVTVVAFFLGIGMTIVRIIQKRFTFFWPLGALIVMVAAFFLASWVAGMTVPVS